MSFEVFDFIFVHRKFNNFFVLYVLKIPFIFSEDLKESQAFILHIFRKNIK